LFDFPCKDRQPVRKRCPDGSYRLPELSGSDLIEKNTGLLPAAEKPGH
jgi:hypothetical protein